MRRVRLRWFYGSHLPVLMKMAEMTSGPILELGAGLYSTVFLHWHCHRTGRRLVTYESSQQYYDLFVQYKKDWHEVRFVEDWDSLDFSQQWGFAFVDHHPGERRGKDIKKLTHVDYVVVHDAVKKYEKGYGYLDAFPLFKYKYKYKKAYPHTMVLSNKHDLNKVVI